MSETQSLLMSLMAPTIRVTERDACRQAAAAWDALPADHWGRKSPSDWLRLRADQIEDGGEVK